MGEKKKSGLLLTEGALRKRYPDSGIASTIIVPGDRSLRLPSTNIALNFQLGGGIPYGKIMELAGEESTGKTLLAMDFAKVAQSLGGMVLWDDAESTFDGTWMEAHGVDLDRVELLPYENEFEVVSDWIADMCVYYRSKLTNNEPILLVVDSLALMETGDAMEIAEVDAKAEMGKRSFNMGKLLRKRTKIFARYGICVIFINQMREKVGASQFEDKNTTPLQQSMKFFASIRIWLFKGKRLRNEKKKWVGNLVYIRTQKNKTAPPEDNIKAEVYFKKFNGNFGYHKYFGFDELLVAEGIVKRKMAIYSYKGEKLCKGEEKFRELIATNNELRSTFIKKLGINTASKVRKQLEAETKNLYPVRLKAKKDAESSEDSES